MSAFWVTENHDYERPCMITCALSGLVAIKPAVAALNMGSMNYAKYHEGKKSFVLDFVFANPFSE